MYMNVLYVCVALPLAATRGHPHTTGVTVVRNQTQATLTAPFLTILNSFDRKTNHLLNSKSWSKIC